MKDMNVQTSVHDATGIHVGPVQKGASKSGRYAYRDVRIETETGTFTVSVFAEDAQAIRCSVTEDSP